MARPLVLGPVLAKDFKPKGEKDRADLFASMPPLEAKKVLFSIAATHEKEFREGRWQRPKLMFIDVKKAHLNGRLGPDDVVFVQMPGSPQDTCSGLTRWLYGGRQAASASERDFVEKSAEIVGGSRLFWMTLRTMTFLHHELWKGVPSHRCACPRNSAESNSRCASVAKRWTHGH